MEYYDWKASQSRKSLEKLFEKSYEEIDNSAGYVAAVDKLMNEGMLYYSNKGCDCLVYSKK